MSRIGSKPIKVVDGIDVKITSSASSGTLVSVKGPLGSLELRVNKTVSIIVENGEIRLEPSSDASSSNVGSQLGLYRSLLNNMILGVSSAFKKELELIGVGYRASINGNILDLAVGHSHHDIVSLPPEIRADVVAAKGQAPRITLESIDKQLLGQVCACIRSIRPPEPYKGKGIRFVGEVVRRKAGKTAKK